MACASLHNTAFGNVTNKELRIIIVQFITPEIAETGMTESQFQGHQGVPPIGRETPLYPITVGSPHPPYGYAPKVLQFQHTAEFQAA